MLSLQGKINKANRKIVAGERERDGGKGLLGRVVDLSSCLSNFHLCITIMLAVGHATLSICDCSHILTCSV